MSDPTPSSGSGLVAARRRARRAIFNSRAAGRAIMAAAIAAAITSLIGAVVAWQLVGSLRDGASETLTIIDDTIVTMNDTLTVAEDVIATVDDSLRTLGQALDTLSQSVADGGDTLTIVADLTETIPPNLDRVEEGLGGLADAAGVVDDVLEGLDDIPFGPDFDTDAGLAAAVDGVRQDLAPIAEQLRGATVSLRALSASSGELITQLELLGEDLAQLDADLARSRGLIERYQQNAGAARRLTVASLDDLNRQVGLSRILIVILAISIAVGQISPFRIGRELARV